MLTVTWLIILHCFTEQFSPCLVYCYKEFTTRIMSHPYFVNNNVLPIIEDVQLILDLHLLEELSVWLFVSMNNHFPWCKGSPIIFTFTRLFFGTCSVNNSLPYTRWGFRVLCNDVKSRWWAWGPVRRIHGKSLVGGSGGREKPQKLRRFQKLQATSIHI